VYAAVVRGLVPPENEDDRSVSRHVFVGETPDPVPLDLQADILAELDEYENLRFVDDPSEAIDEDPPRPVKNEGVYLEFRDVPESGRVRIVDLLRYVDEDDSEPLRVVVEESGGTWSLVETRRAA
jgi:hypothetical protein